jgi:hypothetical protein
MEGVMTDEVKVVCSRGHDEVLIGRLTHWDEDSLIGPLPEDFAPGDPRRAEEPTVVRAGTRARGLIREERPDGWSKARGNCRRCGFDLPVSWESLDRRGITRKLRDAGIRKIELSRLKIIKGGSYVRVRNRPR